MELHVSEYYDKFSLCAIDRDVPALVRLRNSLLSDRQKMDSWFDKFLDKCNKRMDSSKLDTPEWKLYNKKSEEYSELNRLIVSADAYIRKVENNV